MSYNQALPVGLSFSKAIWNWTYFDWRYKLFASKPALVKFLYLSFRPVHVDVIFSFTKITFSDSKASVCACGCVTFQHRSMKSSLTQHASFMISRIYPTVHIDLLTHAIIVRFIQKKGQ